MNLSLRVFVAAVLAWSSLGPAVLAADGNSGNSSSTAGVTGMWLDESKRGGIVIEPCGDKLCGRLMWMLHPLDDKGQPKFDSKNPDPKLRSRSLCGLPLMGGFVKDGPNEWDDGWIYNSEDGNTYDSKFQLLPDGTLKLRGFLGISLLGQSQIWTRPTEKLPDCTPPK
jgi:uncharacterized protein (DUF2147 family)